MVAPPQSEAALQSAVARMLDLAGWLWTHVPNEGKRGRVAGRKLRAAGMKRGVPDVLIFERWKGEHQGGDLAGAGFGVAIELKTAKGRLRVEQTDWLTDLGLRGWLTCVCYDLNQVHEVLRCVRPHNGRRLT